MRNHFLSFSLIFTLFLIACAQEQKEKDLTLWYDQPAGDWYEALPIGNGTLGAMVYGGVTTETLQLNENTLYSGEPGDRNVNLDFTKALPKVRALVKEGKLVEVEEIIGSEWMGRAQDCYQPFGHLYVDFDHGEDITNYRRALDLETAVCKTDYQIRDVSYHREVFASHPDQVIVLSAKGSKKNSISCRIRLEGAHPTAASSVENNTLIMTGQAPALALRRPIKKIKEWNQEWMYPELFDAEGNVIPGRSNVMYGDLLDGKGTFYEGRVGVELEGGTLTIEGNELVVKNATKIKVVLSGDTSFNGNDKSPSKEGVDPSIVASANLQKALAKEFDELKKDHITDYQSLFSRVSFSLGDITEQSKRPTNERIASFKTGKDQSFSSLFLQYARYLTIASSREGGQPINLQGMWNNKIIPPWASAYTMNINAQIFYWMTEAANLSECTEPNIRFTQELSVDGRRHAREAFGLDGWTAHHNTAIWRGAEPIDFYKCSFWPFSGAWLCQQIMTHYNYTKDKQFLKDNWPVLKGAAEFMSGWLVKSENGYYTTPVGSSPENRFYPMGSEQTTTFCEGPTMDIMIVKELFTNCIKSASILGIDDVFVKLITEQRDNLQPYQIGSQGQLLEWDKEYKEVDPQHRHISHLFGLCPGNEITQDKTPALFEAAKRSLEIRGDEGTGWAMAWKSVCWARLKDGNHAYKVMSNLFTPGGYRKAGVIPNMLTSCPPFNIDGNFGGGAAIIEMLLQSHETKNIDGVELPIIELLPALPEVWSKGEISGLRAVNGFEVDLMWNDGQLTNAKIKSLLGEKAILRHKGVDQVIEVDKGNVYDFSEIKL
ncbi:MAG: glycoside hydrolase family 95 protein [Cyclobacteriaceae bacterium]